MRKREHLKDAGVDGRIILKWIFKKWDVGMDCIELAQDSYRWRALGNILSEPSGCINCGEVLDWQRNCLVLRKDCAAT